MLLDTFIFKKRMDSLLTDCLLNLVAPAWRVCVEGRVDLLGRRLHATTARTTVVVIPPQPKSNNPVSPTVTRDTCGRHGSPPAQSLTMLSYFCASSVTASDREATKLNRHTQGYVGSVPIDREHMAMAPGPMKSLSGKIRGASWRDKGQARLVKEEARKGRTRTGWWCQSGG